MTVEHVLLRCAALQQARNDHLGATRGVADLESIMGESANPARIFTFLQQINLTADI